MHDAIYIIYGVKVAVVLVTVVVLVAVDLLHSFALTNDMTHTPVMGDSGVNHHNAPHEA